MLKGFLVKVLPSLPYHFYSLSFGDGQAFQAGSKIKLLLTLCSFTAHSYSLHSVTNIKIQVHKGMIDRPLLGYPCQVQANEPGTSIC